jgi:hypothetical protein
MNFSGGVQNSLPPVQSIITSDQVSVTSIASLSKYGAVMNHVPHTSFVRSYSPKSMAKQAGVPTCIEALAFTSATTTNYQLPWTICVAFADYVGGQPSVNNTLGTIRVISEMTFIGKSN